MEEILDAMKRVENQDDMAIFHYSEIGHGLY